MRAVTDLSNTHARTALDEQERQEKAEAKDIVQFYLDNYASVYKLICDKCKETLAIEYSDLSNPNPHHHQGRQVISLSDKFKSFRPRLDGAMGYQCACGNDTRWAKVEYDAVKHGGNDLPPHDVAAIQKHIKDKKYTPDIRQWRDDTVTETFRVRRIK